MRIRYLDWKLGQGGVGERLKLLRRLLAYLLVREDGDIERALDLLQMIGERNDLFDDELTFEDFVRGLKESRVIAETPRGFALTPRGERFVRSATLEQVFSGLKAGAVGGHRTPRTGRGSERLTETRGYQFGDDFDAIDYISSYKNVLHRGDVDSLTLRESDLEVYETENHVSVATCLLLDVSHSMILYGEDRITPAKRVALALAELIKTRYPKDDLHLILFGDHAVEVSLRDLTYTGVGPYHTNTHAALQLSRRILQRKKHSNKQIFMITDGKPSALTEGGELYLNSFGLDRKIVNKTLDEAAECRRYGIPITTFMIASDPYLVQFVERLTDVNQGRAFFSSLGNLDGMVFKDYMQNRQRRVR